MTSPILSQIAIDLQVLLFCFPTVQNLFLFPPISSVNVRFESEMISHLTGFQIPLCCHQIIEGS